MLCQSPFTQLNASQDCKQLYQFLDFCRQQSIADQQAKIASVALELSAIDPLVVLDRIVQPNQPHFYLEQRDEQKAIVAIDTVLEFQTSGSQRFLTAQPFIHSAIEQLITNNSSIAIPRFFCSFTFFEQTQSAFPAASVFLPRWQIERWGDRSTAIANVLIQEQSNLTQITHMLWQELQQIRLAEYEFLSFAPGLTTLLQGWEMIDRHDFAATVSTALQSIERHRFRKVVLAHAVDVISRLPFQPGRSLHNLRQLYPDCTVFSIGNGQGQSFIGASPERLLNLHQRQLITDALAGSAPRGRTAAEDARLGQDLETNPKERYEHQVVVDFIYHSLTHLGLAPRFASSPTLLKLSNIQHLHTPIRAIVPAHLDPLSILSQLHPTPAVAGMPRVAACDQISQLEPFERSLYAAPLGWIDAEGNAEFVVGIRSALLEGDRARLYAGAGIVSGSDPEREAAEVNLKLQALLRALT